MVSFIKMQECYGAQHDNEMSFGQLINNPLLINSPTPLERDVMLDNMKVGIEWHNNMVRLCASYVSDGLGLEETLERFKGVTLSGYTEHQTVTQITTAYYGAKRKGFDKTASGSALLSWLLLRRPVLQTASSMPLLLWRPQPLSPQGGDVSLEKRVPRSAAPECSGNDSRPPQL